MTIVLAHDPSSASAEAAFAEALHEAGLRQTRLVLVNATRGDSLVDSHFANAADLADLAARAQASGVGFVTERPVDVDVVDAIVGVVERYEADLLVVGIRRRSPVGKLILGSTAQQLMMAVACPVLAVKPWT